MSNLLTEISDFINAHGMSESQFGILAMNDKNFVPQLRNGRDLRVSTAERVKAFMSKQDKAA